MGIADRARMVTAEGETLLRRDDSPSAGSGIEANHAVAAILIVILLALVLTRTGFRGALGR